MVRTNYHQIKSCRNNEAHLLAEGRTLSYTNNRWAGLTYDPAGNITSDGGQSFSAATWQRGYVYLGSQLLVVQSGGVPKWVHQDPVVKSQRLTDFYGGLQATVELDPWGGETDRSQQQGQQPQRFTSYHRDANESDDAMMRRYNRWWSRFDQPDPSDGSYNLTDPLSLNRYSYVQNDPVNYVDPTGLNMEAGDRTCYGYDVWRDWYADGKYIGSQYLGFVATACYSTGGGARYTDDGGGGGGGGGGPEKTGTNTGKLESALDACLRQLFGVSLTSFKPSERGQNGSVTVNFTDPNRRLNGYTGFGVINDVSTYSRR